MYIITSIALVLILVSYSIMNYLSNRGVEQIKILEVAEASDIKEKKENVIDQQPFVHISVDDFIEGFEDLTLNKDQYDSIFDSPNFKILKDSHDKYGTVFTLYSFYEKEDFDLSMATDKFKEEFQVNNDWLKFGFHSLNKDSDYNDKPNNNLTNDYELTTSEILRITGSSGSLDSVLRIHFYRGDENSINKLHQNHFNITGLFTADDKRKSYYLDEKQTSYLYLYDYYYLNYVDFIKTDIRLEDVEDISEINSLFESKDRIIIAFTHEEHLEKQHVVDNLNYLLETAKDKGYDFDYVMNRK